LLETRLILREIRKPDKPERDFQQGKEKKCLQSEEMDSGVLLQSVRR
jgi:hypothetical protein